MTFIPERNFERGMVDYLPPYYHEAKIVTNLIHAQAIEIQGINTEINDILRQYFIETATWGLSTWEKIYGLANGEGQPDSVRRGKLLAKRRGYGTATLAKVKEFADSFHLSTVSEIAADYTVIITIYGTRGEPSDLAAMEASLRELVPAHLNIGFIFTYARWSEFDASMMTWDGFDAKTLLWENVPLTFY